MERLRAGSFRANDFLLHELLGVMTRAQAEEMLIVDAGMAIYDYEPRAATIQVVAQCRRVLRCTIDDALLNPFEKIQAHCVMLGA